MKNYPLDITSVGEDTYIVMSKGHHNLSEFMRAAVESYPSWKLGSPQHVWIKTTPSKGTYASLYNIVDKGSRGAWPATYCYEYGDDWEEYNK